MLCCVGLIGGTYVGQSLGGPWTYIAPAAGFGVGLWADMKFMHKNHQQPHKETEEVEKTEKQSPTAFSQLE
jgi:hypothetical protein